MDGLNDEECEVFNAEVREALASLDGTEATALEVLTGLSAAELVDLGGLPAVVGPGPAG